MERFGIGLIGLSLLCIGIMTLATWRGRAREIIKNSLSKGSIPGMESFLWVVAAFTYIVLRGYPSYLDVFWFIHL